MTGNPGVPAADLDEFVMADGVATWMAYGPGERAGSIAWSPERGTVRAWPFPGGRTRNAT